MKKNLLYLSLLLLTGICSAQNPVPNPGFETWTAGNPDSWFTNNITGQAVPVTAGAAHAGSFGARGEVISTSFGDYAPVLMSTDGLGNGFPATQNYATFSFYFQFNQIGSGAFIASANIMDANNQPVAVSAQVYTSSVLSWTQASQPFYYLGTNPAEALINFGISDTGASGQPAVGNYFLVDDIVFSGLVEVEENSEPLLISKIQPNPAKDFSFIYYELKSKGDVVFDLFDATGKKFKTLSVAGETAGRHKIEMNVADIPSGFYILHMISKEGIASSPMYVIH